MKYSEKLERLEEIRRLLESGSDLEESLILYEESLALYRELRDELKSFEERFEILSRSMEETDEE